MFVKPEYMFDGKVILPSKITKHTVEKHAAKYQSLDCIIKRWLNNIYEKFVS